MAGDWWDAQGVPAGGQKGGTLTDDQLRGMPGNVDAANAKLADPNRVSALGAGAGRGIPSLPERTGGGAPGAGAPTGGGGVAVTDDAVRAILHKYPPTNDGMRAAMVEIDRTFGPGTIKLLDHPERLDKLVMPDGRTIDTVIGAGGANPSWGWGVEGPGHGGGGGTLGSITGGGGSLLGNPMAGRPITDDPSFKFRIGEATKALERSAASKGTLLTGGTLKALTRYSQDYASSEYQNAYARAASEQGNTFNRLFQVAGVGLGATNSGQQLASGYAGNIGNTQLQQGNAQAAGTVGQGNAWAGTVNTLGNLAGQWAAGQAGGDSSKPQWLDHGRGLY